VLLLGNLAVALGNLAVALGNLEVALGNLTVALGNLEVALGNLGAALPGSMERAATTCSTSSARGRPVKHCLELLLEVLYRTGVYCLLLL
jgi:hypothetical protein